MTTTNNTRIVALIERAERETPFCDCGEPMAAIARDRQIWLHCTAHRSPSGGVIRGSLPRWQPPVTRRGSSSTRSSRVPSS